MKNILRLFSIVCLLSTCGVASGQTSPTALLLDSVYFYNWASNNWILNSKEFCNKNSYGQPIQDLFKKYDSSSSQYADTIRVLNGYSDTTMTPTSITDQLLYSNVWKTYQHNHYLYKGTQDTTYYKVWIPPFHKFIYGLMNTYQYNINALPLVSLTQGLDTTTQGWYNISKTTNTYTTYMQPLEQILFYWQNSTSMWENVIKYDNVYDSNNSLVSSIEYTWNDSTASWINSLRTTYSYNMALQPSIIMKETWDTTLHVWDTVQQSLNIYNQYNWLMTINTQNYIQSKGTWENNSLTYYTYFSSGEQRSMTGDVWDTIHLTYITNVYQSVDSATGNIHESYTRYVDPQTFQFTGGRRDVYIYGSSGDTTTWLTEHWSVSGNAWANKSQVNYTYDSHDLLSEKVIQSWENSTSSWQDSLKSDYFYSQFGGINEPPAKEKPCFYSNPMVIGSPIYCPDFKGGDLYTLRVCSLSGSEVYRTNFVGGEAVMITRSLTPGLYILIIEENNDILYKDKVVVLN